jgi:hypothetical protein
MENKILNNLKMIYYEESYGKSSGNIEVFSDIEGYNSIIKCIEEYVLMLKNNLSAKYTISFKGKYDKKSTLNFLFKDNGDLDTISLTYNKTHNIETFNIYANIEMYKYLKERLENFVEDLKEFIQAELNFDSGIDVDCNSPGIYFYHL